MRRPEELSVSEWWRFVAGGGEVVARVGGRLQRARVEQPMVLGPYGLRAGEREGELVLLLRYVGPGLRNRRLARRQGRQVFLRRRPADVEFLDGAGS